MTESKRISHVHIEGLVRKETWVAVGEDEDALPVRIIEEMDLQEIETCDKEECLPKGDRPRTVIEVGHYPPKDGEG